MKCMWTNVVFRPIRAFCRAQGQDVDVVTACWQAYVAFTFRRAVVSVVVVVAGVDVYC